MRIAIVAGEASGDILGAGLLKELKSLYPNAQFEGIGGPLMIEQGFNSFVDMERLSVMGLVEVLGRLRELLGVRRDLVNTWKHNPPDVFIGIDSPDFNIGLERRLKKLGIKTVHYVSPSVWAWRESRIHKIAKSIDLMLTLLPFESDVYKKHQISVEFVGHHLADSIPLHPNTATARKTLGLQEDIPVVCLMPGSRRGEVEKLGSVFFRTAYRLQVARSDIQFVIPAANKERKVQIEQLLGDLPVPVSAKVVLGQSHLCMEAASVILLASGTATLEALLFKKPMVVCYRMAPLTMAIMRRLVKQPFFSLPNLLAGKKIVPELLQEEVKEEVLTDILLERLDDSAEIQSLNSVYHEIHSSLKQNASQRAANAVSNLLNAPSER